MQPKLKICSACNKPSILWKSNPKLCKPCAMKAGGSKPINKVSVSKAKQDKAYSTLRAVYLQNNPYCKANLLGCTMNATDVHHKAGRGENLLNIKTWLSLCRNCHRWIEEHPAEAKERGFSQDRLC